MAESKKSPTPKNLEQRHNVRFCFLLGKTVKETIDMLRQAYGEESMPKKSVYRWFKDFQTGRNEAQDQPRTGRPVSSLSDSMVEKVSNLLRKDKRLSVRAIAEDLGTSKTTVHRILREKLGKRKLASRLVPRILSDEQKLYRQALCEDYLELYETDNSFVKNIVAGDETWVYAYEPETKRQSMEWRGNFSPVKKLARMVKSSCKVMLVTFFDCSGLIHYEFIPPGQNVNQYLYKEILQRLFEKMRKKRVSIWRTRNFRLLHDNARPHTALSIVEFLAKKGVVVMPHPPYSPDLSPCDFFLFGELKRAMKGFRMSSVDEIKLRTRDCLKSVKALAYESCFESIVKRWRKCVLSSGDYFEGDKFVF